MEEDKKSKFSSGLNIITRLDLLWRRCQELKRKGKYLEWNEELDTIWIELARDLGDKEFKDKEDGSGAVTKEGYETKFNKFERDLQATLPFVDDGIGFNRITTDIVKRRNNQYKILMQKQLFLARLENELDKGTTYEDEDDDF